MSHRCSQRIDLDQRQSAEHDIRICEKRREELVALLEPWYLMNWPEYIDLTDLQVAVKEIFQVSAIVALRVRRSRSGLILFLVPIASSHRTD